MELRLERPVAPGEEGEGVLEFHRDVAGVASKCLPQGASCSLMEGHRKVGIAEVLEGVGEANEVE